MIVAYTALHYGSPYLGYAIRSVIEHVDRYIVLYSSEGSHGTKNSARLPESESRESLLEIAAHAAYGKLTWIDGNWQHEGQQRDYIHEVVPDADMILVLDYDEIWHRDTVIQVITEVELTSYRNYRVPMIHYWRDFKRCVLHDPAFPIRAINPKGKGDYTVPQCHPINHMGYAIPTWLLDYKMKIHGHRGEWRTDINWRQDKWLANAQQDCHPVGSEYWNPEEVNPSDYLPDFMAYHPYYHYSEKVIE